MEKHDVHPINSESAFGWRAGMYNLLGLILVAGGISLCVSSTALAQNDLPPTATLLLRYDTNQDGDISVAELEVGLEEDYRLADIDGNNCIDRDEMRIENDRRLERDGSVASPVADWNVDGCVDKTEFGSAVRSYFDYADRNKDGTVSIGDLYGPSMPITPPMPPSTPEQQMPTEAPLPGQDPYGPTVPGGY